MELLIEGLRDPTLLDKFNYQTIMVSNICIILQTGSQFIFKSMPWLFSSQYLGKRFQKFISDPMNTKNPKNKVYPMHSLDADPDCTAGISEVAHLRMNYGIRKI